GSGLVSTISFSGSERMDYSLLGNNVLKDHSQPPSRSSANGIEKVAKFRESSLEHWWASHGQRPMIETVQELARWPGIGVLDAGTARWRPVPLVIRRFIDGYGLAVSQGG
ncbi:MAG: hypothetical protein WCA49_00265, partial [Candidatus Sulfotelmatobacter sp.]